MKTAFKKLRPNPRRVRTTSNRWLVSHVRSLRRRQVTVEPPPWSPLDLSPRAWWHFLDLSSLRQDAAGTVPVTALGQIAAYATDKSGNGHHLTQDTLARVPICSANGLDFDNVDASLKTAMPLWVAGTSRWAAVARVVVAASTHYQTLIESGAEDTHLLGLKNDEKPVGYAFATGESIQGAEALLDGEAYTLAWVFDSGTRLIRQDGIVVTSGATDVEPAQPTTGVIVGAGNYAGIPNEPWAGSVKSIVIIDGDALDHLSELESYMGGL